MCLKKAKSKCARGSAAKNGSVLGRLGQNLAERCPRCAVIPSATSQRGIHLETLNVISFRVTHLMASYLTPIQVSVRTGIPKSTLARWRKDGRGPRFVKHGGRIVYRTAS